MTEKEISLLISLTNDIAALKENEKLYLSLFTKLRNFFDFKLGGVALVDKNRIILGVAIADFESAIKPVEQPTWGKAFILDSLPFKLSIINPQITLIRSEHFYSMQKLSKNQSPIEKIFKDMSIESLLFIPMQTGGELVGFLVFSVEDCEVIENNQNFLIQISSLFASALSNTISNEELKKKEKEKAILAELIASLAKIKEKDVLFKKLAEKINNLISIDYIALQGRQANLKSQTIFTLVKTENGKFDTIEATYAVERSLSILTSNAKLEEGNSYYEYIGDDFEELCSQAAHFEQLKENNTINSIVVLKAGSEKSGKLVLILGRKNSIPQEHEIGEINLIFAQTRDSSFLKGEIDLAMDFLPQLGLLIANVYAFEEIKILAKKLKEENNYLLDEINLTGGFQEIIGNSQALQNTLNKVRQVAPSDATVLIQGETGTGKELIARAIHNLSKRSENTFITVNCASIPAQLIESELFGHEKGSFTSAIERRIGKFEVADGGTIFLDEIGELPHEIQSKLLRVLQEKEFERIGGKSTISSDVRIVSATNRNLEQEVAHGKFRADLFFRLNVFPIYVPKLKDRIEDIPLLVKYFIEKYSKKIGKKVDVIKKDDLEMLMHYSWPGNIRELEHFIERAIIISEGNSLVFENMLSEKFYKAEPDVSTFKTLLENEKEHIVYALKLSNGKITGKNSASQILDINGKTLESKIKKLGIKRQVIITK